MMLARTLCAVACCLPLSVQLHAQSPLRSSLSTLQIIPMLKTDFPVAFSFAIRNAQDAVLSCGPMAIGSNGRFHFYGDGEEASRSEPFTCKVSIISVNGNKMRIRVYATRRVEVASTKEESSWVTQHYSVESEVTVGQSTSIRFAEMGAAADECEFSVKPHKMQEFLAIKDVSQFAAK